MQRIAVLLVFALSLIGAGIVYWGYAETPPAPIAVPSAPTVTTPALDAKPIEVVTREIALHEAKPDALRASTAAIAPSPVVLPPADLPLREIIDELDREARDGNAQAACRLGAELTRCTRVRQMARYRPDNAAMSRWLAQRALDEKTVEKEVDAMLRRQEANERLLARCEDVDLQAVPAPARYFALAAEGGHVPSMVEYLRTTHYNPGELFRDPGLIAEFQANALRYFMTALEAGEPRLLGPWWEAASMPEMSPLAAQLPEAWRDAGMVTALRNRIDAARRPVSPAATRPATPPPAFPRTPPTPAQTDAAERLFAQYFASTLRPLEPRLTPELDDYTSLERYRCDQPTP